MKSNNSIDLYAREVFRVSRYPATQATRHSGRFAVLRGVFLLTVLCVSDLGLSDTALSESTSDKKAMSDKHEPAVANGFAGVLDNKRLFFDAPNTDGMGEQKNTVVTRMASEQKGAAAMDSGVPEDTAIPGVTGVNEEHPRKHIDKEMNSTAKEVIPIRYEAHIKSGDTVRIIVNSLPCQAVDVVLLPSSGSSVTEIHCDGLVKSDIKIVLLADKQRLRITQRAQLLGILSPGQQL